MPMGIERSVVAEGEEGAKRAEVWGASSRIGLTKARARRMNTNASVSA